MQEDPVIPDEMQKPLHDLAEAVIATITEGTRHLDAIEAVVGRHNVDTLRHEWGNVCGTLANHAETIKIFYEGGILKENADWVRDALNAIAGWRQDRYSDALETNNELDAPRRSKTIERQSYRLRINPRLKELEALVESDPALKDAVLHNLALQEHVAGFRKSVSDLHRQARMVGHLQDKIFHTDLVYSDAGRF